MSAGQYERISLVPYLMQKSIEIVIFTVINLTSCATGDFGITSPQGGKAAFGDDGTGVLLLFSEKEPGTEAYRNTVFINRDFIHMSDTRSPIDYLLFNRKEKTIYSVTAQDSSIFVIKPKQLMKESPIEIEYTEIAQPSGAIPKISGKQATHYRYDANNQHCYDVVSLEKDFLPHVVAALIEYREVLAAEHGVTLHRMPKDSLNACDLALNVFHSSKHLQHGLPIREWDQQGFQRFLLDYREKYKMDEAKLSLPQADKEGKEYTRFSITE